MTDRDLDHWLAEHVMGWVLGSEIHLSLSDTWWCERDDSKLGYHETFMVSAWSPTTRIDHAWMVVERMRELGWRVDLDDWDNFGRWVCEFDQRDRDKLGLGYAAAPTASLAICRAAKEAVSA